MDAAIPIDEKRLGGRRLSAKPILAFLITLAVLGLGYLGWWSLQPPSLQSARMSDGLQVSLAAVTSGTVHTFDPLPPLYRLGRAVNLPKGAPAPTVITTAEPETRLWLLFKEAKQTQSEPGLIVFEDEHGCPFDKGEINVPASGGGFRWLSVTPPKAISFGRTVQLCAFYPVHSEEAFRFVVPARDAPGPRQPNQALRPRPLPQRVLNSKLRATLDSLEAVAEPAVPHNRAILRAKTADGSPLSLISLVAEDQYGQRSRPIDSYERGYLKGAGFAFAGLCRMEPAWKLVATAAKDPGKGVEPDVIWDEITIPLNVTNDDPRNDRSFRVGARTLAVRFGDADVKATSHRGKERRIVGVTLSRKDHQSGRFLVTQVDGRDAGRLISELGNFGAGLPSPLLSLELNAENEWKSRFTIPVMPNAKSVTLRIAEYVGHEVEFVIAPPKVRD